MLLQMAEFPSFLWLSNIPLYVYVGIYTHTHTHTTFSLFIHLCWTVGLLTYLGYCKLAT